MNSTETVLLSICIPTFNRAELLRSALLSLAPQVKEFQSDVELIVSDNCSPDNTQEVVEWAQQYVPIRYHRNDENVGPCNNMLVLVTKLARGKFCWVLGDDDFVRPNALKKVLETIKAFPDIYYIYVNIAHFSLDLLKAYPKPVMSADLPGKLPLGNKDPGEYYVEKWEDLIDPMISEVFLGGIMVSIVRRSIYCDYAGTLTIDEMYSSLDSTYPHVKMFAQGLIGKNAYYIGSPLIIVIDGAREWNEFLPKICLIYLHEVLDFYEAQGIGSAQIEKCRQTLVKNNRIHLTKVLKEREVKELQSFSAMNYISRYWRYLGIFYLIRSIPHFTIYWVRTSKLR